MTTRLDVPILAQPDDVTCGPTSLHAVYGYWGDPLPLERVIAEVRGLETHGTLAALLGLHALERGYRATIVTYNLEVFDPTWFGHEGVDLAEKLRAQRAVKPRPRLQVATEAYLDFLEAGGVIRFEELTLDLVRRILGRGTPILTGLSATYLYGCAREVDEGGRLRYDDVAGQPTGHFVVLRGWNPADDEILVSDPLRGNPRFGAHLYAAPAGRVLSSILLGVLTYDANLLIVEPREADSEAGPG